VEVVPFVRNIKLSFNKRFLWRSLTGLYRFRKLYFLDEAKDLFHLPIASDLSSVPEIKFVK